MLMTRLSFESVLGPRRSTAEAAAPAGGDDPVDDPVLARGERRPHPHRRVRARGQREDRLGVREELDRPFPVVRAGATGTDTAEGQTGNGEVRERDVDTDGP